MGVYRLSALNTRPRLLNVITKSGQDVEVSEGDCIPYVSLEVLDNSLIKQVSVYVPVQEVRARCWIFVTVSIKIGDRAPVHVPGDIHVPFSFAVRGA